MELQSHFNDSIVIKNVFHDYGNLVEFVISSGHLPPHICIVLLMMTTTITKSTDTASSDTADLGDIATYFFHILRV